MPEGSDRGGNGRARRHVSIPLGLLDKLDLVRRYRV